MLKLHSRTKRVAGYKTDLSVLLNNFLVQTDLTNIEWLQALQEEIQRTLKYMLRSERHPDDPEKKADEE